MIRGYSINSQVTPWSHSPNLERIQKTGNSMVIQKTNISYIRSSILVFSEWSHHNFVHVNSRVTIVKAVTYSFLLRTPHLALHHALLPFHSGTSISHTVSTLRVFSSSWGEMVKGWVSRPRLILVKEHRPWHQQWKAGVRTQNEKPSRKESSSGDSIATSVGSQTPHLPLASPLLSGPSVKRAFSGDSYIFQRALKMSMIYIPRVQSVKKQ